MLDTHGNVNGILGNIYIVCYYCMMDIEEYEWMLLDMFNRNILYQQLREEIHNHGCY